MRSYTVAPLLDRLCYHASLRSIAMIKTGESPEQRPVRNYNFYKLELQWPLIGTMRPELRLLNLHFFNICRHHPTLKFKPHATDDKR